MKKDEKEKLRQALTEISKTETDKFMERLKASLERYVTRIALLPLFGARYEFESIDDALTKLDTLDLVTPAGAFEKFEVIIDYSNGDTIRASFKDKTAISSFLKKLEL